MRRKWGAAAMSQAVALLTIVILGGSDAVRQRAQRRQDLPSAEPTAETLQALAEAMGAAGFEHHAGGRMLVKRLVPGNSQPDLDVVEHQGVIGKAGVDFPAFPNIPNTGFNCKNVPTGYYADLETDCQVFHICDTSRKISFLCPNGTIFSQSHLICDWWFKVDCASAPALYESSAEYYSNEQKKSQKISQSLSKNPDLQHIGDNARVESRKAPVSLPTTTERFLRHRQRLQNEYLAAPKSTAATSRSFQSLFTDAFNPTQRTTFDKRRRNLVQLISNNFGNPQLPLTKTTVPAYTESSTYRTTAAPINYIKEMQVAAESASFANNNNRQYLQDFHSKNYRPYPVYTPNLPLKTKPKGNPSLTTLYDFRDRTLNQVTAEATTTKRPTLLPYTKSYVNQNHKHEPYTRPGVSLLKEFIEKEKNKTLTTTTTPAPTTQRVTNSYEKKLTIESKASFEAVTAKIPRTTRYETTYFTNSAPSERYDSYSTRQVQDTTEPTYQERRERLLRKINLENFGNTESPVSTVPTEKFYGDLPNRPGLVVPPSLTPKTLHTLAIYYATALDNLSTPLPTDETDISTPAFDEYEGLEESLPGLFSRHTINKYSNLFTQGGNSELLEDLKQDPNGTYNELVDDLSVQQSQNPIATSPQIRELAQVFTHALSAYLQDPVQFRKVLSDIRPTHPSFGDMLTTTEDPYTEATTTINEDDDEILGFSDDNKIRPALASLRDGKALNVVSDYTTINDEPVTTVRPTTTDEWTVPTTTPRIPFRCCGKISASYTTAAPKPTTSTTYVYANTVPSNKNYSAANIQLLTETTTESDYSLQRVGGFQNNSQNINNSPYGKEVKGNEGAPITDYVEATNLPTAWGFDSTSSPLPNSHSAFESKKIRTTTAFPVTTPVFFTETDSVELENEEELQRAHSQSFVTPQNSVRHGKQINIDENKVQVKKPSEELEAPTLPQTETTPIVPTTYLPSSTYRFEDLTTVTPSPVSISIFTSSDIDKSTNDFQWPTTFDHWQSTIIDPITLNDGLSQSGPEKGVSQLSDTSSWAQNTGTTPATDYTGTSEQSYSASVNYDVTTPGIKSDDRSGRLLKDLTSTEPAQDLTTIADTVAEKAREIMGGMNATTTQKLMNVMKKTKSKTVKRLILLLVQTCDDDHNSTAEASKRALLEALMAVSQKDMEEIAKEQEEATTFVDNETKTTVSDRRTDSYLEQEEVTSRPEVNELRTSDRRGKSLNFDPSAINSLSHQTTTVSPKTTTEIPDPTTTLTPRTAVVYGIRRGSRKFASRITSDNKTTKTPFIDTPLAEARVAPNEQLKGASDTRALELLRSLYTIASKWG